VRPFLLLAALAAPPAVAADCALDYRFKADWTGVPRFEASVSFEASARTATRVRLASEWGGVTDFHRGIQRLRVEGEGASIAQDDAPNRWLVKHPPGGRVTVRYDIVNGMPNVDSASGMDHRDFYRNTLGATRFQVFGHAMLVLPEHLSDVEPVAACFEVSGLDPKWTFASSEVAGHRDGKASWRVVESPLHLRSSLMLGGDYRLHRREIAGRPLWVAMRGTWRFDDARFVDATTLVVQSHRRFWGDLDFPHYLISLSPNQVPSGSTGGTAVRNAFAMHASNDFAVPGAAFETILAHEHLHAWVPRRLGTTGKGEAARYWFSEGFTDYLTHRLLLATGIWTLEDYAAAMNDILRRYLGSPAVAYPNARVAEEFWTHRSTGRIPYQRGELFALHLARRLEPTGTTLDGVLRSLLLSREAMPREGGAMEDLAVNRLRAAVRQRVADIDADFEAFIEAGKPLPIGSDFLGPCFVGRVVEVARFEAGFDVDRLRDDSRRVTGLDPGSAAERTGLRNGQFLYSWSIHGGNVERDVELRVVDDLGLLKDIRYRPIADQPLRLPQFDVKAGASKDPACGQWRE
jgi:predicted metalloprotease with PDZ domain